MKYLKVTDVDGLKHNISIAHIIDVLDYSGIDFPESIKPQAITSIKISRNTYVWVDIETDNIMSQILK